ncbi:MAG: hypothetical protein MK212_16010 [Saprospiraceae bacterium]|nr:hypothetical protein [Saprospiraceae bacterium]
MQPANHWSMYGLLGVKEFKDTSKDSGIILKTRIRDSLDYVFINLCNRSEDTLKIPTQDYYLFIIQEAQDSNKNWKPIEYWQYSDCGNSYITLEIPANSYVFTKRKRYTKGDYKTKIRLKLLLQDSVIYSEPYIGSINYKQFLIPPSKNERTTVLNSGHRKWLLEGDTIQYHKAVLEDTFLSNKLKAKSAYHLAYESYKTEDFFTAREYCEKAVSFDPNWGKPLLLIGIMYARSVSSCADPNTNSIEAYALVVAAIRKWEEAIKIDPRVETRAKRYIERYSNYLPSILGIIHSNLREDQVVELKCWINETIKFKLKR